MAVQTYTTVVGDTLSSIAQHVYGDANRWPEIYAANKAVIGSDPGVLFAGKVLTIPDKHDAGQGFTWYTVQPGDTLYDIGMHVSGGDANYWRTLHEANRDIIGDDPKNLQAGTRIRIPSTTTPPVKSPITEQWQRLGGTMTGDPAAIFYRDGAAHVFTSSTNGTLTQYFNGIWEDLGGAPAGITQSPGAAVRGGFNIHLGIRGSDGQLYHRYWNGNQWSGWEQRGGTLASGPSLVSWDAGRLDGFACGTSQNLIHCSWNVATGWSQWENLSAVLPTQYPIQFAPAAVSWNTNRLDVFATRAGDGHLLHCWWDGVRWNGFEDLGGILNAAPAVVTSGMNRLECYGRGTDGQVYQRRWNGTRWDTWQGLGGMALASAPTAVVGEQGISLFARGTDSALWTRRVSSSI